MAERHTTDQRPTFDDVSPARRRNMAAIKATNTKPEQRVRSLLHGAGYRFRLHRADLPGRPDIVLSGRRTAIFVHGCFWHRHGCANSVLPKTRTEWWDAKLTRNVERDRKNQDLLLKLGWTVLTIWECELRDEGALLTRLNAGLSSPGSRLQPDVLGQGQQGETRGRVEGVEKLRDKDAEGD